MQNLSENYGGEETSSKVFENWALTRIIYIYLDGTIIPLSRDRCCIDLLLSHLVYDVSMIKNCSLEKMDASLRRLLNFLDHRNLHDLFNRLDLATNTVGHRCEGFPADDWSQILPSGKLLHNYGKIHHFLWENPLFQWPFSIAMLVYQRVCVSWKNSEELVSHL